MSVVYFSQLHFARIEQNVKTYNTLHFVFTGYTYKTKDRVTRTSLKIGGELMRSTSDTRHVKLVVNTVLE
jgi:hypothetical protein